MRMKVKCGNDDCRSEFFVDSSEAAWTCTECGREIQNRNYPFLTAKLMQAKIDGHKTDWRMAFGDLLELAVKEIGDRAGSKGKDVDLAFLDDARKRLKQRKKRPNDEWRQLHDELLVRAREVVLALEAG